MKEKPLEWAEYILEVSKLHAAQRELDRYKMEKQAEINKRWELLNARHPEVK